MFDFIRVRVRIKENDGLAVKMYMIIFLFFGLKV